MLDGIQNLDPIQAIVSNGYEEGSFESIRNAAIFITGVFAFFRNQSSRDLELADVICRDLMESPEDGLQKVLVFLTRKGKTNDFGNKEAVALCRGPEVQMCPVAAFGVYYLWLFDSGIFALPDILTADWKFPNVLISIAQDP